MTLPCVDEDIYIPDTTSNDSGGDLPATVPAHANRIYLPKSTFNDVRGNQHNHISQNFVGSQGPRMQLQPVLMDASNRTECLPETRTDILKSIQDWTGDMSRKQSVFFLFGMAGVGKSVISTTIANRLRTAGRLGAFLFFDREDTQRSDPNVVIKTIAYQMGSYDHQLGNAIHAAIKNIPYGSFPTLREQFQKFIVEPLLAVRKRSVTSKSSDVLVEKDKMPVVVVLDNLDQCGDAGTRKGLLAVLGEETARADLASILRIIITSRATPDIRGSFDQSHIMPYELDTTSHTNHADIITYLRHRAQRTRRNNMFLQLSPDWPGDGAIRELAERASGLFMWAAAAWDFIDTVHHPHTHIQMLSRGQLPPTVEATLVKFYRAALELDCQWDDHNFVDDFRMILGVIVVAKESLSSTAIDQILNLPPEQPSLHAISRLSCLLSHTPTIRVLHPSFSKFLCTWEQCRRQIWLIDPVVYGRALAILCLELLNKNLKRNICNMTLSTAPQTESLPEGVAYACIYWIEHVCDIKVEKDIPPVLVHLDTFINRHLLHWIEAMSILKRSQDTTRLLRNLSEWIMTNFPNRTNLLDLVCGAWHTLCHTLLGYITTISPNPPGLFALVSDACRFSEIFARSIEEHPLLVYFGALPFAPITSATYQKFHDHTLFPYISGGFQKSWSSLIPVLEEQRDPVTPMASTLCSSCIAAGLGGAITTRSMLCTGASSTTHRYQDSVQLVAFSPSGTHVMSRSFKSFLKWDTKFGIPLLANFAPDHKCTIPRPNPPCMIQIDRDGWLVHVPTQRIISKLPAMITPLCSASTETSVAIGTHGDRVIIVNFPPDFMDLHILPC